MKICKLNYHQFSLFSCYITREETIHLHSGGTNDEEELTFRRFHICSPFSCYNVTVCRFVKLTQHNLQKMCTVLSSYK